MPLNPFDVPIESGSRLGFSVRVPERTRVVLSLDQEAGRLTAGTSNPVELTFGGVGVARVQRFDFGPDGRLQGSDVDTALPESLDRPLRSALDRRIAERLAPLAPFVLGLRNAFELLR